MAQGSYAPAIGYRHEQTTAAATWTITHNLNTDAPVVDVWIDIGGTYTKILPQQVSVIDKRTVSITFSSAQTGRAFIA